VKRGKARADWRDCELKLRLRRGESGFEHGIGLQASGKLSHKAGHVGMPMIMEAKGVHFSEGLVGGPVLDGDAIGGDEDAGAVFAEFAVNEYCLRSRFAEEGEELRKLRGRGSGETVDGNVYKTQAKGFREMALVFEGARRFTAKVNDGGDAESLELRQRGKGGLRSAKELIGDFSRVVNATKRDSFGAGRRRRSICGRLREGTERS